MCCGHADSGTYAATPVAYTPVTLPTHSSIQPSVGPDATRTCGPCAGGGRGGGWGGGGGGGGGGALNIATIHRVHSTLSVCLSLSLSLSFSDADYIEVKRLTTKSYVRDN